MKRMLIYISLVFFIACGGNEEPIAEKEVEPPKQKSKFKTYKRAVSEMQSDMKNLERHSDIENAKMYILKTFDSYKSKIPSSSNSK